MFNNLSVGKKIGLGFTLIVSISVILGVIAIQKMDGVETEALKLAKEYSPEVSVANNVERYAQQAMYNMRGYSYTEDETVFE